MGPPWLTCGRNHNIIYSIWRPAYPEKVRCRKNVASQFVTFNPGTRITMFHDVIPSTEMGDLRQCGSRTPVGGQGICKLQSRIDLIGAFFEVWTTIFPIAIPSIFRFTRGAQSLGVTWLNGTIL